MNVLSAEGGEFRSDYVEFPLSPFESIEYKYRLEAGQAMLYSWQAEGEVVFDFHSEEEGTDPEDAISFSVGRAAAQHGSYVAPYTGIHGWFWENRGQQEVTVRLKTTGYFSESTTFSRSGEYVRQLSLSCGHGPAAESCWEDITQVQQVWRVQGTQNVSISQMVNILNLVISSTV